jgi:hypothetical protein
MPSIFYDIQYLKAASEELETFLLSEKLYWPINAGAPSGEPAFMRLTLGGLLLANQRLHTRNLAPNDKNAYLKIDRVIQTIRLQWRSAWERKANWEFTSRLKQWQNYLNELQENPEGHSAYYSSEVRLRVLLQLLEPEINLLDPAYLTMLNGLDRILAALSSQTDFIWDEELQTSFLKETFWFLWGQPMEI